MVNSQQWIDENYPKDIRSSIKELYLRDKNLEGQLNLSGFINLERLDCSYNQLTSLNLTNFKYLKVLYCDNNYLENLDFLNHLNPQEITSIIIDNNNLPEQDISVFSPFTNLEELRIGSTIIKNDGQREIYNRFYGSLKSLENLTRLEDLNISNTDINDGTEFLPKSVKRINYSTSQRPESKLKEMVEKLKSLLLSHQSEKDWKKIHPDFDPEKQMSWESLRFSYQQTKEWVEIGLHPSEVYFASYLKEKGYRSSSKLDLEGLRKEDKNVQTYLDKEYSSEARKWTNWLEISKKGLKGDLILKDWPNLEKLDCYHNRFTSLTLKNCPKLTRVVCSQGTLTDLNIENCPEINNLNVSDNLLNNLNFLNNLNSSKITYLYLTNNKFAEQDISAFSKFSNLKYLYLANNSFTGNLQSLKNLDRLQTLSIANTKVNSGFEYLPDSLNEISSNIFQELDKKTASGIKIARWANLMTPEGYQKVPYYDFHYWKETNKELIKLFISADRIKDIKNNIQDFFNIKKNIYLKTQKQINKVQSLISLCENSKYVWAGIGAGSGVIASIGYDAQWGAQGGTILATVSGTLAFAMNEVVKNNLQKTKDRLEKKLANKSPEEFIQTVIKLEKNYLELIEIRKDLLANVFKENIKSERLWGTFSQFLDKVSNLPPNILKKNIELPEDSYVIEVEDIDDAQQKLAEAPQRLTQQLTQGLENNLVKYEVEEAIVNLIEEVSKCRP